MDRDASDTLSYFQSFDLVQREFQRWHGRELNAERTWEIVSSFVQGQEYFVSASTAAEAVRPLLLYYGVLSVGRGLILFLTGRSEATIKSSHGLALGPWEETLIRERKRTRFDGVDWRRYVFGTGVRYQ
jgi:hypothetical protein